MSNVAAAVRAARHDLILHSDANTPFRPDSLAYLVADFVNTGAGILSCAVVGEGERSLWAAVENAQLTVFTAPAMCFASGSCRQPCVVGKAMLFRRSELQALGGLEAVKDLLAHDYFLGRLYADGGKLVLLSRMPVANVNVDRAAAQFFERHVRWLQMRLLAHPLAWSLDLFSIPPLWAIVAFFVSGFKIGELAILVTIWSAKIAVDSETTQRLRGQRLRPVWAFPLRDVALRIAAMISLGAPTHQLAGPAPPHRPR